MHQALDTLYDDGVLTLADATSDMPPFDDNRFLAAAQAIYRQHGFTPDMLRRPDIRRLVEHTASILNHAVETHLPTDVDPSTLYALENNAFIFSAFKTYHSLSEVGLSLVDESGQIKPFEKFKNDVLAISRNYNHHYLRAEYQHAVGSTLMASRWQQIERDGDRYDLQYRTAADEHVRESHRLLHGITLPPSDPFWDKYLPPNGWGCRCTAVQVRKGKYPQSDPDLSMRRGDNCTEANKQKIFRYNPGKTLKLFPPQHPYLPKGCDGCEARTQFSYTRRDNYRDECLACHYAREICLNNSIQRLNEWKQTIDARQGLSITSDAIKTGKLLVLRKSVRDTIGHTRDINVIDYLSSIEQNIGTWQYIGWKKVVTDTRTDPATGTTRTLHNHKEAAFFLYYKLDINGRTYYANVIAHKHHKSEVLYCIRQRCNVANLETRGISTVDKW